MVFKVGDKVKFVGKVYSVLGGQDDSTCYDVLSDGFDCEGNRVKRFMREELLEIDGNVYDRPQDQKTKFKVGDKVKYVGEIIEIDRSIASHSNYEIRVRFCVLSDAVDKKGNYDTECFDAGCVAADDSVFLGGDE